ncbi:dipeptide ABC transporter ATP-binding protein [Rhizobium oryziradicis]|uniref:Glutathione import ATP-binding protein GsiA n=1 Tax=Rhizobium oryziradicis TaxID=1867956 RepID=A0A1Q8ZXX0_9HYPH|nr:dipeptide ABC transporter ATP-binding protein [Rhizobium oryziradicis]OLP46919.1 glutathione ABC transporter ATP-binding protein GsiA [Rhizobium oryziradicis]
MTSPASLLHAAPSLLDNQVLAVDDLTVSFATSEGRVRAVRNVSFDVGRGETLAIVGESGSGKSVTSLALMRLIEHGGGRIDSGSMLFRPAKGPVLDLATANAPTMRNIRGADIAMIFQEPMTSLNPVFTAGEQIAESLRLHQNMSDGAAKAEALRMLDLVRIPEANHVFGRFPHQLSGGMRQRVMIAMALACRPSLLIADEPTTALDVTVQAQILQMIRQLQDDMNMGVLFITHDMGVVAEIADRVLVMCQGEKVEHGASKEVFEQPKHPYTKALLAAVPRLGAMAGTEGPRAFDLVGADATTVTAEQPPARFDLPPILKVRDLVTRFPVRRGFLNRIDRYVHAVEKVSFDLYPGETLALVGESGCGKSTTGRSLLRLVDSQSGNVEFDGRNVLDLPATELRGLRRNIQLVFQDPFASLDPRLTVGFSIMEPLLIHGIAKGEEARKRVAWLLERVGLTAAHAERYPHEFSGGQRQRVAIARALALNPKVVVADESVSALDVSIQAQIVNLLLELQRDLGISYLFISHDMAVVERVSHRVAVMYLGQIVEIGPRRAIFENPQHPYTKKLMAAVPIADPARRHLKREFAVEDLPSPVRKKGDEPVVEALHEVSPGHFVARHAVGVFKM